MIIATVFDQKRCCQDAIEHLYRKLVQRKCPQLIVEGDIKSCFDQISHDHICNTLREWKVKEDIIGIIQRMLTTEIFEDNQLYEAKTGTPQGGILSPMLANVALTALDNYCETEFGRWDRRRKKMINPIVRYADDFVIVAKTEDEAKMIKEKTSEFLMEKMNLELSEEKTRIVNVHDGFDFLGFDIRKYKRRSSYSKYHEVGKLIIKPQKEKVVEFLKGIKEVLNENKQAKAISIIRKLNQKLRGFAMYYRFVCSKHTFHKINQEVNWKLWQWASRRHPNKDKGWIRRKYFTRKRSRERFYSEDTNNTIALIDEIPIVRYKKIKSGMRVHDGSEEAIEYWKKREYENGLNQIYSIWVEKLYKNQEGICLICEKLITKKQIEEHKIEKHHMLPKSESGTDKLSNLRLLHQSCHKKIHSLLSRKQMAYWYKKNLNYISSKCVKDIIKRPQKYAI